MTLKIAYISKDLKCLKNVKARMYYKAKELVRKCYVLQPYNH